LSATRSREDKERECNVGDSEETEQAGGTLGTGAAAGVAGNISVVEELPVRHHVDYDYSKYHVSVKD
jgi:hypothetical protein